MMRPGVVTFLDALGVKGIWARGEADSIAATWQGVIEEFRAIEAKLNADPRVSADRCQVRAFSDTVIITLEGTPYHLLLQLMAEYLAGPFVHALLSGFYFRGVFTVGEFDGESGSLLFGPAVDDAAAWYEHADWIGVSTTPASSFALESAVLMGHDLSSYFRKYQVPTGQGAKDSWSWALDWPQIALEEASTEGMARKAFKASLFDVFSRRPIVAPVYSKYENTLVFFDETPDRGPVPVKEGTKQDVPDDEERTGTPGPDHQSG